MRLLDAVVDLAIVAFIFVVPMTAGYFISVNTFSIILFIAITLIAFILETGVFYMLFKRLNMGK